MKYFTFYLLTALCFSCQDQIADVSTFNEDGSVNAMIEIPAGTNYKLEYSSATKKIERDQIDGKDRIIDFLPYPANYGFIPGTLMDGKNGDDGDPLDVFVICSSLSSGKAIAIQPIGMLKIKDQGELDIKIIAVPKDVSLRTMKADSFADLSTDYHLAQQILQNWVLSYQGLGSVEFWGWEDERAAIEQIKKWAK